jgi:hypothetical protein
VKERDAEMLKIFGDDAESLKERNDSSPQSYFPWRHRSRAHNV